MSAVGGQAAMLLATPAAQPVRHRGSARCTCQAGGRRGGARRAGGGAARRGAGGRDADRLDDTIREQRQQQVAASDLLARLLQAEEPRQVAEQYVSSLDEQFFWTVNTYVAMAKKEGNREVVAQLEGAMRAAFEAKQATLRPEIQLLNRLLAAEGAEQRRQALQAPEASAQLLMNDRYFFQLLGRMLGDVQRQPESEQRAALLAKLEGIQADTTQQAAAAEAAA